MHSVLIIEDDHDIRVLLRDALEEAGYSVSSAANGADGLAMLARIKPPSIILLDWNMPILSGEEFLKAKLKDQALAGIPTLVISAVAKQIQPVGAVEIMCKPLDLDCLLKALKKYCP